MMNSPRVKFQGRIVNEVFNDASLYLSDEQHNDSLQRFFLAHQVSSSIQNY